METLDYYSVGTRDNIVVSSSYIKGIMPDEGGSPRRFLSQYDTDAEKKDSVSLESGKLIHKYIEDKDKFVIADITKPTDMMAGLIEKLCELTLQARHGSFVLPFGLEATITSDLKTEKAKQAEILEITASYEKLATRLKVDVKMAVMLMRAARKFTNAYKSLKEVTLLSNVVEKPQELAYIDFLFSTENKQVMTKEVGERVRGAIESLTLHPIVSKLLGIGYDPLEFEDLNVKVYRELPVYWQELVPIMGNDQKQIKINCKALLDNLRVDFKNKIIIYTDLKSTANSIYLYQKSFEYYHTYRQMAIYNRAIAVWFKNTFPDLNFQEFKIHTNIVPVETNSYYNTTIYAVGLQWLYKGRAEAKSALSRIAYHLDRGYWDTSYEEIIGNGYLQFKNPE